VLVFGLQLDSLVWANTDIAPLFVHRFLSRHIEASDKSIPHNKDLCSQTSTGGEGGDTTVRMGEGGALSKFDCRWIYS
jgi:hypothetical protein